MGGGRSLPACLSPVAAFALAAAVSGTVLRDQQEYASRRRSHDAYLARPPQPGLARCGERRRYRGRCRASVIWPTPKGLPAAPWTLCTAARSFPYGMTRPR